MLNKHCNHDELNKITTSIKHTLWVHKTFVYKHIEKKLLLFFCVYVIMSYGIILMLILMETYKSAFTSVGWRHNIISHLSVYRI